MASHDPLWVKIADFGTSKRLAHTALRTMVGTPGYLAPELLRFVPRMGNSDEFTYALDIWSLGCLVHELLTSQTPFCETDTEDYCDESGFTITDPQTDMGLLCRFCLGDAVFPTEVLQSAQVTEEGIDFVKELLAADPRERPEAVRAQQSPWLRNVTYRSTWYTDLRLECVSLGLDLTIGNNTLMRNFRTLDIAKYLDNLPSGTAKLTTLLERSLVGRCYLVAGMLINSRKRLVEDPLRVGVMRLFRKAVEDDQEDWTKLLLAAVTSVNSPFPDNRTALQVAIMKARPGVAKLLLQNGADMSIEENGKTVLQIALENGSTAVMEVLLEHKPVVDMEVNGRTLLQIAVERKATDMVQLLLRNDADPNANPSNTPGRTAIEIAARTGCVEIVKLLLEHNAGLPFARRVQTAFHAAVDGGQIDIIKVLLENNVDVNFQVNDPAVPQPAAKAVVNVKSSRRKRRTKSKLNDRFDRTSRADESHRASQASRFYGTRRDNIFGETSGADEYRKTGRGDDLYRAGQAKRYSQTSSDDEPYRASRAPGLGQTSKGDEPYQASQAYGYGQTNKGDEPYQASQAYGYGQTSMGDTFHQANQAYGFYPPSANFPGERSTEKTTSQEINTSGTAMHNAAGRGYFDVVQLLLNNGADVNLGSGTRIPLMAAVSGKHTKIVKLLLDNNANLNAIPSERNTPTILQAAVETGVIEIVKLLLACEADINAKPPNGNPWSTLETAIMNGDIDMVKLLLANGADINGGADSRTALLAAVDSSHIEIVQLLLDNNADINDSRSDRTPLEAAATHGYVDITKLLLRNRADINGKSPKKGRSALHGAARKGHRELVLLLLEAGADIDSMSTGQHGRTALHEAVRNCHSGVVSLLLSRTVDINAQPTPGGRTLLRCAAEKGFIKVVDLLLKNNADINIQLPPDDLTALHGAIQGGHVGTVDLLLRHKADVNAQPYSEDGETPLELAINKGHHMIAQRLLRYGGRRSTDPQFSRIDKYRYNRTPSLEGIVGWESRVPAWVIPGIDFILLVLVILLRRKTYQSDGKTTAFGTYLKQTVSLNSAWTISVLFVSLSQRSSQFGQRLHVSWASLITSAFLKTAISILCAGPTATEGPPLLGGGFRSAVVERRVLDCIRQVVGRPAWSTLSLPRYTSFLRAVRPSPRPPSPTSMSRSSSSASSSSSSSSSSTNTPLPTSVVPRRPWTELNLPGKYVIKPMTAVIVKFWVMHLYGSQWKSTALSTCVNVCLKEWVYLLFPEAANGRRVRDVLREQALQEIMVFGYREMIAHLAKSAPAQHIPGTYSV